MATLLLVAMFAYDVWWVFLQPLVTDSESVMITVRSAGSFLFYLLGARGSLTVRACGGQHAPASVHPLCC